jgi:hypothetical protein
LSIKDANIDKWVMKGLVLNFENYIFFSYSAHTKYALLKMNTLLDEPELSIKAQYLVK